MLFGNSNFGRSLDSLDNIEMISRQLAGESFSTVMRLVMDNTMFPLYRPFSFQGWQYFTNSTTRPINRKFLFKFPGGRKWRTDKQGIRSYFLEPVKGEQRYLRFCPECVSSDNSIYGEPYWHRSHQIYGINLCHKHGLPLAETTIETMPSGENVRYVLPDLNVTKSIYSKGKDSVMLRIAQAAYWLLNFNDDLITLNDVKRLYKQALTEKGNLIGKKFESIPSGLEDYCLTNDISTEPIMQLRYGTFVWVKDLVDLNSCDAHPVDHLIFMDYLGIPTKRLILDQNMRDEL